MNILALDIGTTSMRGILYDESGSTLGIKSCLTPLIFVGEYIEQSAETFHNSLIEICKDIQQYGEVDAISITAFRSAPALIDKDGNALSNFIMWQDTRNKEICERCACKNESVYNTTGANINAVFTATKITWLKENMPEAYEKAYKALVVPDYLINFMTGAWTSDRTYGSRTSLMNIKTLEWDDEMIELFNLDKEKLPELVDVGTVVGKTHKAFEEKTGIKEGTPVVSSGGDQQNGALGLGEFDSSSLVINCGTGSFIISVIDEPYLTNHSMICNVSAIRNKYTVESNVLASAAALNWLIKELYPDLWHDGNADFEAFNDLAKSSPVGANGIVCVPLFQGCGTRDWNLNARASFSNLCLSNTRADLARAMFEGIAAEIAKSVQTLPEVSRNAKTVFVGGGLTKSEFFNQVLADMLGKQLCRYSDSQATAIGAFINAAVELGLYPDYQTAFNTIRKDSETYVYEPNMENHEFYKKYINKTEKVYEDLNIEN